MPLLTFPEGSGTNFNLADLHPERSSSFLFSPESLLLLPLVSPTLLDKETLNLSSLARVFKKKRQLDQNWVFKKGKCK
jgi:hypothetical protein